jgi:hypothetical protein
MTLEIECAGAAGEHRESEAGACLHVSTMPQRTHPAMAVRRA